MNTKNKIYTAVDFANYHKGNMSFAEMHALEKDALEDPFLADALEGYASTQTPEKDLLAITKRLLDHNGKAKIFSGSSFIHTTWLRMAALLVVILGVGYFFYNKYNSNETTIAQNKTAATDTLQIAEANTENLKPENKTVIAAEKAIASATEKEIRPIKSNLEKLPDNNVKDDTETPTPATSGTASSPIIQQDNIRAEEDKRSIAPSANQQNNTQNYSRYYTQQGNVTDLKGGPLQNVTVTDRNGNNRTITDNNGQFKLKTTDSNAYVSLSNVEYESKEVLLNNNTAQKITLNRRNDNLQEVVVVSGYGTKRKKSEITTSTSTDLSGKVAGVNVESQKVTQPAIKVRKSKAIISNADTVLNNTASFNEYVNNNIIPLFDENNKQAKGKVILSFEVDKNGRPQNIVVVNTSCNLCNSQAINLLKNGPAWLSSLLQQQIVAIAF